jgi:phosphatidylinositol alpha-1,6-mannosyltransferase
VVLIWHLDLVKCLFFLRATDARIVLFLHGVEAWKPQSLATRMLLRRVHLFLSNSAHTWERFVALNPEFRASPHRTVHLGIGEAIDPAPRSPVATPLALMISRMLRSEDYKGHREVVAAWPLVLEQVPGAELRIIGDGDLRRDLEELVRARGLAGHVGFLGALRDAAKEEALTRSRCLLMPSRGEGFGLVYLEAMRMGRPCLVSTQDAGREVVNPPEAGLAADPANSRQVADAVCRLLARGEEWERWSRQTRCRYEECFTAAKFKQRLVAALSEVTGGKRSVA